MNPVELITSQLISRYTESYYPSLTTLSSLIKEKPPVCLPPVPIQKPTTKKALDSSSILSKENQIPLSPAKNAPQRPTHPAKTEVMERRKLSSWLSSPVYPTTSYKTLIQARYSVLDELPDLPPLVIPCCIYVHEDFEEEILFFNRLAKILTQQLFPCRLATFSSKETTPWDQNPDHCLYLSPLNLLKYTIPQAEHHHPYTQDNTTWVALYSSLHYEKAPELKRALWNLLTHQPFAYTQKS